MFRHILASLIILTLMLYIVACQSNPEPIVYGEDNCENCKMTISDPKYGAELITDKGKIFKFDSVECLADYSRKIGSQSIASMWVTDLKTPESLINTKDAFYILSDNLRSPMGLNLSAFSKIEDLDNAISEFSGSKISWDEILNYVSDKWN